MNRPTRLALAALLTAALPACALAGTFGSDEGDDFRTLTKAESHDVLENFRAYRRPDASCLRFVITHAERNSDEDTRYTGELVNAWDDAGMITRLTINREGTPESGRRTFLIRGGKTPSVWTLDAAGVPVRADADALKPLLPGLVFTPYDLQLPFIAWADATYRETDRFRTRPTDYFTMKPDAAFKAAHPEVASVTLGFDRAYNALMRAETVDADGKPLRDLRAESFGKIRGQWIVREMELRDRRHRSSDTLTVKSAATGLRLDPARLTPASLASPLPHLPDSAWAKAD